MVVPWKIACLLYAVRNISATARGGHSHRRCSHGCDRGQEAVKESKAVFGVSQAVKDHFQTW